MLRGQLSQNEPMGRHCSYRSGGRAQHYYKPADLLDLAEFLAQLPKDQAVFFLGLGSNLLVRDGGIAGTTVATLKALGGIEHLGEGRFKIGAGVPCAQISRFVAKAGFTGAEFFSGIPGVLGGALAMNAGAWESETWDFVESVQSLDRRGIFANRKPWQYDIGYRHCVRGEILSHAAAQEEWFVGGILQFEQGDVAQAQANIRELLAQREATQPLGDASCGSVFRNPEGDFAARLIESAGLKGHCIGGACVSSKHANFIINKNHATASDIEALVLFVQAQVAEKCDVDLIPEIRIVGEAV